MDDPELTQLRAQYATELAEAKRNNRGRVPYGHAASRARELGLSSKTLQLDAKKGGYDPERSGRKPAYTLSQFERDQLAMSHGYRAAAYRRLPKENLPSYSTWNEAVNRDFSEATLADMEGGDGARRSAELVTLRIYEYPLEVVVVDEKKLSIEVRHPVERDVSVVPTAVHFRDGFSGAVVGCDTTWAAPTWVNILRGMADCLDEESDVFPFAGTPGAFQWDEGTCHTADEVTLTLCGFHIPVVVIKGYHPHHDGIVESVHGYAESDFCVAHGGYLHGRRRLDGSRYRVRKNALQPWEDFVAEYRDWVRDWNFDHEQRLRGKRTPVEIWEKARSKPKPVDPALFARLRERIAAAGKAA